MKKKILYTILICFIIFNLFIFIYNYINHNNTYIILNKSSIWKINNNKVTKVNKKEFNKLNYSNAKLYRSDKTDVDGYIDNKFNFFKNDMGQIQDTYYDLYVVGDAPLKNYTYLLLEENEITDNDKQIVSNFIKTNNFQISDYEIKKMNLSNDITIYSVYKLNKSNPLDTKSYIFYYQDNIPNIIYESNDKMSRKSYINKIVDINNDGYLDLILLSDIYNSAGNECYSLYMYEDNTFKPVINCEED